MLHSDNGSPMKGATLRTTLQRLGVIPSFGRPSVSDNNPYSGAPFKALKYTPAYPSKRFDSPDEARAWVHRFVWWDNFEHHHSALKLSPWQSRTMERKKAFWIGASQSYELAKNRTLDAGPGIPGTGMLQAKSG